MGSGSDGSPLVLLSAEQLDDLAQRMGSVSLTPSLGASLSGGSATPDLATPPPPAPCAAAEEDNDERTPEQCIGECPREHILQVSRQPRRLAAGSAHSALKALECEGCQYLDSYTFQHTFHAWSPAGGQEAGERMDAEADGTPAFQEAGPVLPARVTRSAVKLAVAHQASAAASASGANKASAPAAMHATVRLCERGFRSPDGLANCSLLHHAR